MGKASKTKKQQSKTKTVEDYRLEGNEWFKNGKAHQAIKSYTAGLDLLLRVTSKPTPNGGSTAGTIEEEENAAMMIESTLRSNRAMAYLKERNYAAALDDCNVVVDELSTSSSPQSSLSAKIFYRRAVAREGMLMTLLKQEEKDNNISKDNSKKNGKKNGNSKKETAKQQQLRKQMMSNGKKRGTTVPQGGADDEDDDEGQQQQQQQLLLSSSGGKKHHSREQLQQQQERHSLFVGARRDLQKCVALEPSMKETVDVFMKRLQSLGIVVADDNDDMDDDNMAAKTNGSIKNKDVVSPLSSSSWTVKVAGRPDAPPLDVQRRDILLLLQQRRGHSNQTTLCNEAFFLVPWDWWCAFCHVTRLIDDDDNNNNNETQPKTENLVDLLPRGAQRPVLRSVVSQLGGNNNGKTTTTTKTTKKNNKSSTSSSATASTMEFVLGEINTERLATERWLQQHQPQHHPAPPTTTVPTTERMDQTASASSDPAVVAAAESSTSSSSLTTTAAATTTTTAPPVVVAAVQEEEPEEQVEISTTTTTTTTTIQPILHHWLVRGHHYEILPREVYATLVEWYGQASSPIVRRIQPNGKICLYEKVSSSNNNQAVPPSPHHHHHHPCAACGAPNATKFCRPCQMRYCSRSCQERHWKAVHKQLCGKQLQQQNGDAAVDMDAAAAANNDKNDGNNDQMAVGTINDPHHRVGLGQLGNTCFLNAAVQALAHATPLVRYFLSGAFVADINTTNPLGSGGKLAQAFDATVAGLRMAKPSVPYYSPIVLKRALAGSRFAGCQQHDAQEFLGHVLDGLHEDLNRITSYDYVELPDVPPDQHHGISGAQVWDAQCLRNNSVLWDTFYGQFKSTCVCPHCSQVSVSFDSFNHVSLEIPQRHSARSVRLCVFLCRPDRRMERLGFSMSQQSTIKDLKMELLSGINKDEDTPISHVTLCDVEGNDITTIFADSKLLVDAPRIIFAYLVNSRNLDDWMIMYCHAKRNNKNGSTERLGLPCIISAPKETSTFRQVWEEIWRGVAHLADHDRSKVRIRLMKRNGMPFDSIPVSLLPVQQEVAVEEEKKEVEIQMNGDSPQHGKQQQQQEEEEQQLESDERQQQVETTSLWPPTSNALVRDYISTAKIRFLFMHIEWTDAPHINDQTLSIYEDHPTHKKIMEELKAEKLASTTITLEQCLSTFQKPERLDEHNMWYCNQCKIHVPAMKTIELWRLPNIMILHLKRFEFRTGFRREKLDMLVDFPLEGLEVTCSQNDALHDPDAFVDSRAPATYDCFAVINHYGRMGFGHYTAFARQWDERGIQDNWYLFDDSRTQAVSRSDVVTEAAYVLFYRRRE